MLIDPSDQKDRKAYLQVVDVCTRRDETGIDRLPDSLAVLQ